MKTAQWKTGFQALKTEGPEFRVVTVLPNTQRLPRALSPAMSLPKSMVCRLARMVKAEFGVLTKSSDGTVIHLKVVRDGFARSVALTLKELVS
jgi:hypothetical protein